MLVEVVKLTSYNFRPNTNSLQVRMLHMDVTVADAHHQHEDNEGLHVRHVHLQCHGIRLINSDGSRDDLG